MGDMAMLAPFEDEASQKAAEQQVSTTAPKRACSTGVDAGPSDLVIASGCSQFGLFRLHVIRPKMSVDEDKWIAQVEDDAKKRAVRVVWKAQLVYEEAQAGFWHLRLYWKEEASNA